MANATEKRKSSTGSLLVTVLVGIAMWLIPAPEGVGTQAWHLLAIFVATIVGIVTKPLPMGAVAILWALPPLL